MLDHNLIGKILGIMHIGLKRLHLLRECVNVLLGDIHTFFDLLNGDY